MLRQPNASMECEESDITISQSILTLSRQEVLPRVLLKSPTIIFELKFGFYVSVFLFSLE